MSFKVGQDVECIKELSALYQMVWPTIIFPTVGSKYKVRDILFDGNTNGREYILVEEIRNHDVRWNTVFREAAWPSSIFRPLTNISVFQELTKVRELEDA